MAVLAPPATVAALDALRDTARDPASSAADVAELVYVLMVEVYGEGWDA